LLEEIEEGLIGVAIRLLKNAVEIAHRLMVVQNQAKANRIHNPELAAAMREEILGMIGINDPASLKAFGFSFFVRRE